MDRMREKNGRRAYAIGSDGNEITFRVQGAGKREIELRHAFW